MCAKQFSLNLYIENGTSKLRSSPRVCEWIPYIRRAPCTRVSHTIGNVRSVSRLVAIRETVWESRMKAWRRSCYTLRDTHCACRVSRVCFSIEIIEKIPTNCLSRLTHKETCLFLPWICSANHFWSGFLLIQLKDICYAHIWSGRRQ